MFGDVLSYDSADQYDFGARLNNDQQIVAQDRFGQNNLGHQQIEAQGENSIHLHF
jgi:hypothetical protein